jgi:glutamate N-acetyltransferase/amino-acid N-acetyltransferase
MTTDTEPKRISRTGEAGGRPFSLTAVAKGAGMIRPDMATMLCFVVTDIDLEAAALSAALKMAVDRSFNRITIDGDTSTNDTVIALTNGQSRTPAITAPGPEADRLTAMLNEVCTYLAKSIARDGEGATCLIEVSVSGAASDQDARKIARTIAGSSLVKSAIFGRDPNWGRIAGAVGRSGVALDQAELSIQLGDFILLKHGQPQPFDRIAAHTYLKQCADASSHAFTITNQANDVIGADDIRRRQAIAPEALTHPVQIIVTVGNGAGTGQAWGCDLSYDYVKINAEYTT